MRNNETGEFEMVLGNKQLLSGFFVVVILFGVFFTMGYIVGRNSAPAGRPGETPAASGQPPTATQQASSMPPAAAEAPKPAEGQPAEGPQPTTQPAQDTAAAPAPQTAAQPPAQPAAQPPAQSAAGQPIVPVEPVAGATYLQVMAVQKAEAEVVVKTLREKGLPAIMSPGPKDLLRVLVGPYNDAAALGQAKTKLQNAGFDAFVRK